MPIFAGCVGGLTHPWYRSMTLDPPTKLGDWEGVLEQIQQQLTRLLGRVQNE